MSQLNSTAKCLRDGMSDAREPRGIWAVISTWIWTMSAMGFDWDDIAWGIEYAADEYAADTVQHRLAAAFLSSDLDARSAYAIVLELEKEDTKPPVGGAQ